MGNDWSVKTREFTFSTGRSATLRESLPTAELIRSDVFDGDDLIGLLELAAEGELRDAEKAIALSDAVCVGMFVNPRITLDPEQARVGKSGAADIVHVSVLDDAELKETVQEAFSSIARAAGFRGDGDGSVDSGDGKGVGKQAKPRARSGSGKPRSARARKPAG